MEKERVNQKRTDDPENTNQKRTGFAERLKAAIGGKSIRAFAQETGISYGAMHKYFASVTTPTLENLVTLAKYAGVSIEWLATGETSQKEPVHPERQMAKNEEHGAQSIIDLLDALTTDEYRQLTKTLKREGVGILLLLLDQHIVDVLRSVKTSGYGNLLSGDTNENKTKQLIELLPIRNSLKEVIRIGLTTTEETDKEVCAIMMRHKEATQPDNHITNKKSGTM